MVRAGSRKWAKVDIRRSESVIVNGISWKRAELDAHPLLANNVVLHCAVTHFRKWCLSQDSPIYHHLRPHIITTKVEHDAVKLPLTHRYAIEAG
ncbi:Selenocysteine lyase [Portunus trituberculatus]|uniref:Selenocysteine lyase n=1 Tax=Portunus trituberculatus TaxID=210409 RepID=A0A5B7GHB5_PORTR|nr:Selenocysteine lyase [Portunus trituberculatus]